MRKAAQEQYDMRFKRYDEPGDTDEDDPDFDDTDDLDLEGLDISETAEWSDFIF